MAKRDQCVGANGTPKKRYATAREARRVLSLAWRNAVKGRQKNPFLPCRVYPCARCKGYHLTSKPKIKPTRKQR